MRGCGSSLVGGDEPGELLSDGEVSVIGFGGIAARCDLRFGFLTNSSCSEALISFSTGAFLCFFFFEDCSPSSPACFRFLLLCDSCDRSSAGALTDVSAVLVDMAGVEVAVLFRSKDF